MGIQGNDRAGSGDRGICVTLETWCMRYWNAALFIRRAPDRDHKMAWRIVHDIISNAPAKITDRAYELLEVQENE